MDEGRIKFGTIFAYIIEKRNDMRIEKELYPVFAVDICTSFYAMEDILVGAEDKEDLREHLADLLEVDAEYILSGFDWRVSEQKGIYTDRPYEVLNTFSYYE